MTETARRIEIYDTTCRDGTQGEGVSLSLRDKLSLAQRLDDLGVDYIEGGYPLSNPKDAEFFVEIAKLNTRQARIAAFGMTRHRGVKAEDDEGMKALLKTEAPVVAIVGKSSPLHVRQVLQVEPEENLAMIGDSIALMARHGREVFFDAEHFFDGYRDDPQYALQTLGAAVETGATRLILCDTNGGSLPEYIAEVMDAVAEGMPEARLGIHTHNDSGLAVAGALAGVMHGAIQVQGTINGLGERAGNADLTVVVANLVLKCSRECLGPDSLRSLTEISRFVYELANLNLRDTQPFVGRSAFAHKGGMHVHGIRRDTRSYEHVDPAAVGNTRRILISELSGASNIAAKADAKFNIEADRQAQKKVLQRVVELEGEGYQFEAAEASFELLVRKTLGGRWYPGAFWQLDHYRCNIFHQDSEEAETEGVVRMIVAGQDEYTVASGDGPVNALDGALRKALRSHFPCVDTVHLDDYKVRVVDAAAESAAKVRVAIRFHDAEHSFGTVGVSTNIIEASWLALTDAFEYKLLRQMEEPTP